MKCSFGHGIEIIQKYKGDKDMNVIKVEVMCSECWKVLKKELL